MIKKTLFIISLFCITIFSVNAEDQKDLVSILNSYFDYTRMVVEIKLVKQTPLLSLDGNANEKIIKTLDENTDIKILGITPGYYEWMYGKEYYLINTKQSSNAWLGWISKDEIVLTEDQEKSIGNFECSNFSNNNQFFAFSTGWMKSIIIINNQGHELLEVKLSDLIKIDPNSVDSSIIGWSSDSNFVWFETNLDSFISSYGRINVKSKSFELIDHPNNFSSYQIAIDLNTGNTIYTDFPYQFDTDTAAETKKSGKVFTLYKNNLFDPREIAIDTNTGEGFRVEKDRNNNLVYKKNNARDFTTVSFSESIPFSQLENRICKVTTNLRLRNSPKLTAPVLVTLQAGVIVKVIQLGASTTIDGINGNWVKVEMVYDGKDKDNKVLHQGTMGWCFSGYLE
jgi:hypothetical protein